MTHKSSLVLFAIATVFTLTPPACPADQLVFSTVGGTRETAATLAVLREAYTQLGYDIDVRYYHAHTALTQSNAGLVDGELQRIGGIARRYENLIQVPIPVNYLHGVAFTTDAEFSVRGWFSLKPYRIGIVKGIIFAEQGTRGMNVRAAESYEQLMEWLDAGEIDVAIMPRMSGLAALKARPDSRIRELPGVIETLFVYHYLNTKNEHLVPGLQRELKAMLLNGTMRKIRDETYAELLAIGS